MARAICTFDTYATVSLDSFMAALGGLEEAPPHPRDVFKQRLRALWKTCLSTDEIASRLETTGNNVRAQACLMGLPTRKPGKRPGWRRQLAAMQP